MRVTTSEWRGWSRRGPLDCRRMWRLIAVSHDTSAAAYRHLITRRVVVLTGGAR